MLRALTLALLALALAIPGSVAMAQDKDKKKDKPPEVRDPYEARLPPGFFSAGPYVVRALLNGKMVEGRVSVAIEASSMGVKDLLKTNRQTIDGILYPYVVKLFSEGRPTPTKFEEFKVEALQALQLRFQTQVKSLVIRDVMG
jgi:hypothetical protein